MPPWLPLSPRVRSGVKPCSAPRAGLWTATVHVTRYGGASGATVATNPVEGQGPCRPPQLHPSDMKDTPVAVVLPALGRRARSFCTRTTALLATVRSQWPPRALWVPCGPLDFVSGRAKDLRRRVASAEAPRASSRSRSPRPTPDRTVSRHHDKPIARPRDTGKAAPVTRYG